MSALPCSWRALPCSLAPLLSREDHLLLFFFFLTCGYALLLGKGAREQERTPLEQGSATTDITRSGKANLPDPIKCGSRALRYALEHKIDHGIWGGATAGARRNKRRAAPAIAPW